MPNDPQGSGKAMWPHNIDEVIAELEVLLADDPKAEEVVHLLEEIKAILSTLLGNVGNNLELNNGLLPSKVIPPLDTSHLPDLSGNYQSLDEKDKPGGFAGLDKNGKLSPYTIPSLVRGLQGDRGSIGAQGPQGPKGERGPQGLTGEQGPRGHAGESGPAGKQGPRGASPDLSGYVKKPSSPQLLALNGETLARDLAYLLAELGLVKLT